MLTSDPTDYRRLDGGFWSCPFLCLHIIKHYTVQVLGRWSTVYNQMHALLWILYNNMGLLHTRLKLPQLANINKHFMAHSA